jgi:hypothetical protein
MNIPIDARAWIDEHMRELEHCQGMTPAMGALMLEELSDEYYAAFKRELIVDLEKLSKEAA